MHSKFKIVKHLCSTRLLLKKGVNLTVISGFLHFVFWTKNLWTLFLLHILIREQKYFCLPVASLSTRETSMLLNEYDISALYIYYTEAVAQSCS